MSDRVLSIPEVATRLGVSKFTVRSWIRQRRLEHFKLGRRVLVAEGEVARFMEAARVPAREG